MLFGENILVALAGLKANIMRSLLTMLGIIIGIASVIAIMTVGNSITLIVNSTMQDLGANNLEMGVVQKSLDTQATDDGMNFGSGYVRDMTDDDLISQEMLDSFRQEYKDNLKYVLISESVGDKGKVSEGKRNANVSITGLNRDSVEFKDLKMLAGRQFLYRDYEDAKRVCMVTDKFVDRMYDGDADAALGQKIEISTNGTYYTYYIVGVYEYVQSQFSFGVSDNPTTEVYIPLSTARTENHTQNKGYSYFTLVTTIDTNNDTFANTVRDYFNVNFYSRNDAYEVLVLSMSSMMDSMNTMISMIQLALSVIAGISLVVGGIGVMNIMLVSVTERTKEIGIRMAVGARQSDILQQFLIEAVLVCLIGGGCGVICSYGIGVVFGMFVSSIKMEFSVTSIVAAVTCSSLIGMLFGYLPAKNAAKLNPIDALARE